MRLALRDVLPVFEPSGLTVIVPLEVFSTRLNPVPLMLDVHPLPVTVTVLDCVSVLPQLRVRGLTLKVPTGPL